MEVEELMVGNWVLYKSDNPKNAFPIQVTLDMMYKELRVWKDRFEPILLTKEILEKNGFKKLDIKGCYYCCGDTSFVIRRSPNLGAHGNTFLIGNFDDDNIFYWFVEITYVHELQLALKLSGINKKIVL